MKNKILQGDSLAVLKTLDKESINMCMTSPPYWSLRDYGVDGQLGLETTFNEYINKLCDIFDEVKRVIRDDGTCWINLGDSYSSGSDKSSYKNSKIPDTGKPIQRLANKQGLPPKTLCMIPMRFAIEMVNRGWILRNTIIWHKPNCMPTSVKDRFTVDFEYIFFFSKKKKYYFEQQVEPSLTKGSKSGTWTGDVSEKTGKIGGYNHSGEQFITGENRNKRTTWAICPKPFKEAHFAVYPEELCETPIRAGCPIGGVVLDPFAGAGTTGVVAKKQGKNSILIELNPDYCEIIKKRLE